MVHSLLQVMGIPCAALIVLVSCANRDVTKPVSLVDATDDALVCPAGPTPARLFGGPCATSADCHGTTASTFCVFKMTDGCSAQGRCFEECGVMDGNASIVSDCACDGPEEVAIPGEIYTGYSLQPLRGVPGAAGRCVTEASTPVDANLSDAPMVALDAAPVPEAGGSPLYDASQVAEAGEAGFDGGPNCRRDATAVVAMQGSCCDTQDDCQVPGTGLLSCCLDHVCRYCGPK